MRFTSALAAGLPGTTATSPDLAGLVALSWRSRRRPPFACFASGPWQAKQLSESMGSTSRLKLGASAASELRFAASNTQTAVPWLRKNRGIMRRV